LNFDFYDQPCNEQKKDFTAEWLDLLIAVGSPPKPNNLAIGKSAFEKTLLLHSEQRSTNVEQYQNNKFIPVYYWAHAIIARDWFRYAEHVAQCKNVQKPFLIYNRAWSGTREYRLKFAEFLIRLGLQNECRTSVSSVEPELSIHYELHKFKNPIWRPSYVLENYFPINTAPSHYSADFDIDDYQTTDIEVVLETLFDDSRLHLTEKILRPIACGQPFILAGTYGSLEYLHRYGFKTFMHLWDERYDQIEDPEERLIRIADVMRQIANWDHATRENKMSQARIIADYNKQHFFSQEFFDCIVNELKENLTQGFDELNNCNNFVDWLEYWNQLQSYSKIHNWLETNQDTRYPTKENLAVATEIINNKLLK
jgi:hypothetical protein